MIRTTEHGENIAYYCIQGADPYGCKSVLTAADIYLIIDSIHSNVMLDIDGNDKTLTDEDHKLLNILSNWMDVLSTNYELRLQ